MTRFAMAVDLNTCVGCNACMAACSMENQTPVWAGKWRTYVHDEEIGTGADVTRRFFPRLCNHCSNPPCMTVCPTLRRTLPGHLRRREGGEEVLRQ
ncbi:MAG: 4Fe-4S dicluster domain-containing protein [Chromatiaceae bacterium]